MGSIKDKKKGASWTTKLSVLFMFGVLAIFSIFVVFFMTRETKKAATFTGTELREFSKNAPKAVLTAGKWGTAALDAGSDAALVAGTVASLGTGTAATVGAGAAKKGLLKGFSRGLRKYGKSAAEMGVRAAMGQGE